LLYELSIKIDNFFDIGEIVKKKGETENSKKRLKKRISNYESDILKLRAE